MVFVYCSHVLLNLSFRALSSSLALKMTLGKKRRKTRRRLVKESKDRASPISDVVMPR